MGFLVLGNELVQEVADRERLRHLGRGNELLDLLVQLGRFLGGRGAVFLEGEYLGMGAVSILFHLGYQFLEQFFTRAQADVFDGNHFFHAVARWPDQVAAQVDDLDGLAHVQDIEQSLDELAREGARRIIRAALELEVEQYVQGLRHLRDRGTRDGRV